MTATESLHPVQFQTDKTDREQDKKSRKRDAVGEANVVYDPSNLREDQYERLGREEVEVNPKREAKKKRIS